MPTAQRTAPGAPLHPQLPSRRFAQVEPSPLAPVPTGPTRLERLGLATESVAHDFNNVLSVIMVCAGEIAAGAERESQAERAREIREAAERGAQLSRRLLAQDTLPESAAVPLAIDAAIAAALPLLRRTLSAATTITVSSEGHLPSVLLGPGELERMLVNLAANSRDAMDDAGSVAVTTGLVSVPPGVSCLAPGWCVRISFSDSGSGMDPEVARRAVESHFTTKPRRSGSGLGLATVHGLLRSRGGDLRINTARGSGTTISLYLPAVRAAGQPLSLAG